jgi:hypothetical protein
MISRRLRSLVLAVGSAVALTGCTTNRVAQVDPEARAAIGEAATASYTGQPQRSDRLQVAAVDHPNSKEIELINLTPNAVPSPSVWVNGAYVRRLPTIPPQGTATVKYAGLLQAGQPANDFAIARQTVTKVELQTGEGLFTVLGPAIKR